MHFYHLHQFENNSSHEIKCYSVSSWISRSFRPLATTTISKRATVGLKNIYKQRSVKVSFYCSQTKLSMSVWPERSKLTLGAVNVPTIQKKNPTKIKSINCVLSLCCKPARGRAAFHFGCDLTHVRNRKCHCGCRFTLVYEPDLRYQKQACRGESPAARLTVGHF